MIPGLRPAGSLSTVPEAMRCQFASCEHVMVISTKPRFFICKTDLSALHWTQLLQLALLGRPVASLPVHSALVSENILLRALHGNHHTRFILFSIAGLFDSKLSVRFLREGDGQFYKASCSNSQRNYLVYIGHCCCNLAS